MNCLKIASSGKSRRSILGRCEGAPDKPAAVEAKKLESAFKRGALSHSTLKAL
jgi:hypothetical protein